MTTEPPRRVTRAQMLGYDTYWNVSDLGVAQRRHDYPTDLLAVILDKAWQLKNAHSERRHLALRFIPGAHTLIPEINDLVHWPGRLTALSELAGTALEPYPVSVISSTITFMGASDDDGVVDWHADGIPVTEIIPLHISDDAAGGRLRVYRGNHDRGMAQLAHGQQFAPDELLHFPHRLGHSTLAQLMRVLHSTEPMSRGTRVSLNLNLRSRNHPYVDDNPLYYLAADNPSFDWVDQYIEDVRTRQLPAYLEAQA